MAAKGQRQPPGDPQRSPDAGDLRQPEPPIHVLSLGAGVQSSTMALMAAKGEITPMPTAAVFADTEEPQGVYDWLDWLEGELPFPVYRVREKDGLLAHVEAGIAGKTFIQVPFFTSKGIGRRQCTNNYKIKPITRELRKLAGYKFRQRIPKEIKVVSWIGISVDEIQRQKDSREHWIQHRWPLLEMNLRREQCVEWMLDNGYPEPPRSACWFCPYHSNKDWRHMKDHDPVEFAKAVELDNRLREGRNGSEIFIHPSREPLGEVDLSTPEESGQLGWDFNAECEGLCGN